jgi:ankyrin repeat protein
MRTSLLHAVQTSNVPLLEQLIAEGLRIEKDSPEDGNTVLHYAATFGNPTVLQLLLGVGGTELLNRFDSCNLTPLTYACESGHTDAVRLLVEAGADPNAVNRSRIGNTPLREVVETATYDIIRCLIDAGADPVIPGWMQLTALDKAHERFEDKSDAESQRILELLTEASKRTRSDHVPD